MIKQVLGMRKEKLSIEHFSDYSRHYFHNRSLGLIADYEDSPCKVYKPDNRKYTKYWSDDCLKSNPILLSILGLGYHTMYVRISLILQV